MPTSLTVSRQTSIATHGRDYADCKQLLKLSLNLTRTLKRPAHSAGGDFFLPERPQFRQPMNTELIIQILTLLLDGGGVIALFFITERKTKAQIENINLAIDEWQKIAERCRTELNEARTSEKEFQDLYMVQFDINTKLRQELDEKNTRIAVLTLLRCKKLKCIDREPPYGSEINEEIEQ